jgi:hypothetical protein
MDLLSPCRVDPVHQSPQTRTYGFSLMELFLILAFTPLASFPFPTIFAGCLPRSTPVADLSVTYLSTPFRYYSAVQPFGYGAPHLSASGTLTLQNDALLSTHFRVADQ